jgi:hypothetical protein
MRIKGRKIEGVNQETIIIPRGNGETIVLIAQAVLSYEDFDKICEEPVAPVKMVKGGLKVENLDDPAYKEAMAQRNRLRMAYIVLKSLEATPDLEWDLVDMSDPNTWLKYREEWTQSGFSEVEQMRIINAVMSANSLNEAKLEEARESFLRSQAQQPVQ